MGVCVGVLDGWYWLDMRAVELHKKKESASHDGLSKIIYKQSKSKSMIYFEF